MSDPLFPSTPQAPLMSTGTAGPRAGQTRYLADLEETPLLATDALTKQSAPSSLYRDAWRKLRKNPIFVISALLILFILFLPNGLESLIPKVKDWFAGGKRKPAKAERPAEAEQPTK